MNPTSKLTDIDNAEQPQLSFQRKAVKNFRTRKVPEVQTPHPPTAESFASSTGTTQSTPSPSTPLIGALNDLTTQSDDAATGSKPKRFFSDIIDVDSANGNDSDDGAQPKPCEIFISSLYTCS